MKPLLNIVRSWVSIVAVLAVAMLGVLALDRSHDNRHLAIDRTFQTGCERIAAVVHRMNEHALLIERNRSALADGLAVAAKERGQTTNDRLEYARLEGLLDSSRRTSLLDPPNCDNFAGR